jgi:hypothetical protein
MPTTAAALALLTTPLLSPSPLPGPLPQPGPCPLPAAVAELAADVFARGSEPGLPALTDPGGPFRRQQTELQNQLQGRFGDLAVPAQIDRQLGRR